MSNDTPQFDQVRRVEQRFQRRSKFAVHVTLFAAYFLFCVVLFFSRGFLRDFMTLPNPGDLLLILIIWGTAIAAHSVWFYFQEAGDRAIQREIDREVIYTKRKRNRLSDDADEDYEIGEIFSDEPQSDQRF
jgi:hypothetical protein